MDPEMNPLKLRYQRTFLHIAEDKDRMFRSSSAPELHRSAESRDESVIHSLLQRLEKWPTRPSSREAWELWNSESFGSRGHPEFCARPCVYFVHGKCRLGASCSMCHELHNDIPLTKSERRKIEDLNGWQLLMVMYEGLRLRHKQQLHGHHIDSLLQHPDHAVRGISSALVVLEAEIVRLHPNVSRERKFLQEVAPELVESMAKRSTSAVLSFAKPTRGVNETICDALASILENIRVAHVLSSLLYGQRVLPG